MLSSCFKLRRILIVAMMLCAPVAMNLPPLIGVLSYSKTPSEASCSHYLRAIKLFTRWLWRNGRCSDDALAIVTVKTVARSERRHVRRALDVEEYDRLIKATEMAPMSCGMSGIDRSMLYAVACATGFRANELRTLTVESFHLDADAPCITVAAAYSKRRRDDQQPIPTALVQILKPWLEGREKGSKPFAGLPTHKAAEMFRLDLKAARAAWLAEAAGQQRALREKSFFLAAVDASGNVVDFHALRHSYITWLVQSGANVKTVQELARHSTPVLTFGIYAHMTLADSQKALAALPGHGLDAAERMPSMKKNAS